MENKELDRRRSYQRGFQIITAIQEKKRRRNKIAIHFQEAENHTEEDMNIQLIDRLLSIPGNQEESTIKLKRVEGFWQAHLRTVGENGLNTIDELLRNLLDKKFKQLRRVFNPY